MSLSTPNSNLPSFLATAGFDHQVRTRILFGSGVVDRLGEVVQELGGRRVLVVTDAGLVAAGHVTRVEQLLASHGCAVIRFDAVKENPSTTVVEHCRDVAAAGDVDVIVALGGGSSMDTAKGCNFLLTNGGRMEDYWGVGKATRPMLPLIAVPTTAGTGSEVQSYALIASATTHQKMACGDPKVAPRVAVLDPELTVSQPAIVTARTGMDTITHAVETAVTRRRNPVSEMYSRESFRLAVEHFPRVLQDPDNVESRGAMLLSAAWAGLAIENSMLGAAHSLANPLTMFHDVAHGQAVGMMLPHVVRFNANVPAVAGCYRLLARAAGLPACGEAEAVESIVEQHNEFLRLANMELSLEECGIPAASIKKMAGVAAQQWTAQFNPRDVSESDFGDLYRAALGPGDEGSKS